MSLTESADGAVSRMPVSATKVGLIGAKLAGWGVATVAVTFMILRPRGRRSGTRGSLFFGSGAVVVLCKTLLMVSDGSDAAPAVAAGVTVSTPVAQAPNPAPPTTRTATASKAPAPKVARPKAQVADGTAAKGQAPAETTRSKPAPAQAAKVTTVAAPAPKPAPKPAAAQAPKTAAARPALPLGPRYADKNAGYSVQFPAGWTYKNFTDGQCWILDATDGQSAVLSVGFSQFPPNLTVDQIVPAKVTKGLQSRPGTVVHSTGYTTVAGRRCLWHKYTGPIPRTDGSPRMTAVHYLLPLQDGRALELRVAATPETFTDLAPRMKQSLDSFKLLAVPAADPRTAKAARATKEVPKG